MFQIPISFCVLKAFSLFRPPFLLSILNWVNSSPSSVDLISVDLIHIHSLTSSFHSLLSSSLQLFLFSFVSFLIFPLFVSLFVCCSFIASTRIRSSPFLQPLTPAFNSLIPSHFLFSAHFNSFFFFFLFVVEVTSAHSNPSQFKSSSNKQTQVNQSKIAIKHHKNYCFLNATSWIMSCCLISLFVFFVPFKAFFSFVLLLSAHHLWIFLIFSSFFFSLFPFSASPAIQFHTRNRSNFQLFFYWFSLHLISLIICYFIVFC